MKSGPNFFVPSETQSITRANSSADISRLVLRQNQDGALCASALMASTPIGAAMLIVLAQNANGYGGLGLAPNEACVTSDSTLAGLNLENTTAAPNGYIRFTRNATEVARFNADGHLVPGTSVNYTLGTSSLLWLRAFLKQIVTPPTSPAQITSNQDDYNPGAATSWARLSTDASRTINSLAISPMTDGQRVRISNVGAQPLVLANQAATGTASFKIITGTGANLTVAADQSVDLIYDATTERWRVLKNA